MNKVISNLVIVTMLILFVSSCTDNFEEINTDPLVLDQSAIAESPLLQGQALAYSQFTSMNGGPGEFQLSQNLFSDVWAQYFATTASGFESDRYEQVGRWSDAAWRFFYGDAAPQLKLVEDITAENGNAVGNAIAKIWRVHSYQRMTDHWGPIPYSSFGNGELSVPFDSQQAIYDDFFVTLDEAVAQLNANPGGTSFTAGDLVYTGNGDQWLKFANSLRLRAAMRIKYVDVTKAQQEAEKAVAAGVFSDNSDNARVATTDDNRNPLATITNWGEFRMSATMESILEGYEDPRLPEYFAPAVDGDSDDDGSPYEGLLNGQTRIELETSKNADHSDLGIRFLDPANGGTNPAILVMNAAEVYFLRAEGALEGWSMGGSAQELYEEGIRTSMADQTGADAAAVEAYVASTNTPVLTHREPRQLPISRWLLRMIRKLNWSRLSLKNGLPITLTDGSLGQNYDGQDILDPMLGHHRKTLMCRQMLSSGVWSIHRQNLIITRPR